MTKYYNKELFNSTLSNIVGEIHFTIQAVECNKNNVSLKIGLANKDGFVYIFNDTFILNKGDRLDIESDNIKCNITDWVYYV
jgi:hypothetical protein